MQMHPSSAQLLYLRVEISRFSLPTSESTLIQNVEAVTAACELSVWVWTKQQQQQIVCMWCNNTMC